MELVCVSKEYWDGIEISLRSQRKFFERGIAEIDANLERISKLKNGGINNE